MQWPTVHVEPKEYPTDIKYQLPVNRLRERADTVRCGLRPFAQGSLSIFAPPVGPCARTLMSEMTKYPPKVMA